MSAQSLPELPDSVLDQAIGWLVKLESSGADGIVGLPITVEWLDGDWKYNFERFEAGTPVGIEELTTYVQWSGLR